MVRPHAGAALSRANRAREPHVLAAGRPARPAEPDAAHQECPIKPAGQGISNIGAIQTGSLIHINFYIVVFGEIPLPHIFIHFPDVAKSPHQMVLFMTVGSISFWH
jgi:hypothetical protein